MSRAREHVIADKILAGDKLYILRLPLLFLFYELKNYGFYVCYPLNAIP